MESATVILMSAEDGLSDTIRPRLEDMGADLTRVVALRGLVDEQGRERPLTLADLDVIEAAILEHQPVLVIIDPIIAYVAGKDANKAHEVRSLLAPLAALAEKYQTAIIAIRHLNKNATKATYRGQGSIDFLAACRSAFVVGEDPQDSSRKVLCHTKSNLGPKTPSLTYTITDGRFQWGEETSLTAEQVLAVPVDSGEKTKLADAQNVLEDMLSNGPMSSLEAEKEARQAGISSATLKRARHALGVIAKKSSFGGGWTWTLPERRGSSPMNELLGEKAVNQSQENAINSTKKIMAAEEAHGNGIRGDDPLGYNDPWC
jgi:AAA domain-containing protein